MSDVQYANNLTMLNRELLKPYDDFEWEILVFSFRIHLLLSICWTTVSSIQDTYIKVIHMYDFI